MIRFIISCMIFILTLIFSEEAQAQAQVKRNKTSHKTQARVQAKKSQVKKSQVKKSKVYPKKSAHHLTVSKGKKPRVYYGTASYYSNRFNGRKTANGTTFRQSSLSAASNRIPLGTMVKVTNLKNKKSIVVKVNDRMGSRSRRLIDLTKAGAKRLGFAHDGITRVKVEPLHKKNPNARR